LEDEDKVVYLKNGLKIWIGVGRIKGVLVYHVIYEMSLILLGWYRHCLADKL